MKKATILCLITCALTSSNNTFGMLLKQIARSKKYIRTYQLKQLPDENIFNTECPVYHYDYILDFIGHLHNRNNNAINNIEQQIKILKKQNSITTQMLTQQDDRSCVQCEADIKRLKFLEKQLQSYE